MTLMEQEYLADVKAKTPLQRLVHWIQQRELVRLRRAAGETYPWTADPIISAFRFCNVRRMDDKVSQWLLRNWYKPQFNHPNMLAAVALARFVNKPEALHCVTKFVFRDGGPDWDAVKEELRRQKRAGYTVFNGAYMVRGNTTKSPDKIGTVVDEYVAAILALEVGPVVPESMQATHQNLLPAYGLGSFMAGQITADLVFAVSGTWADRKTWAPIGPGSKRGMNIFHDREVDSPLSQEQFLAELRDLIALCERELPASITSRLDAMDYQNCLCETSGYEKVLWGRGRKKQLYPGRG